MTSLEPYYEESQSIYDVSDEFFALFLDPTMGYTCAYFERDDMTLEEAQNAKFDLALGKLNLEPGMTLLDIGCGWGATLRRAIEKYDVNVVGLTLSENQAEHVQQMFDQLETNRSAQVLLEGWEKFDEPVDRIVSIGAFEHFGRQRWGHFFKMAYRVLPADGVMLLHTISRPTFKEARAQGTPLTHEVVHFTQFILAEIFPGGWLPTIPSVEEHAADAGFKVTRIQSLQLHYARTLEIWAAALESNKDKAIAIQSEKVYDRYMKYLTGCAKLFRQGYTDVNQFTCEK
ncbi:cyclopropane mycolic acid synthase family methyltransferase [Mycobacterium sp. 1245805.9]|uniref:cyclopropane mycolic acid synthase family methyltransferase n=1 Tax=Mycobacterium sp. 1245805.9 TaxID=1856862 RepID=UPI0007FCCAC3|nr:cyclopropane mycolic acid synthase family methyltransferase [Mycobacterium sp. 1245805.9]OBI88412.1 SAM-dependent methyltransferase [Mycobacterium sp. 1245805.9]